MHRFSEQFLEAVREATEISDVVSDYVALKRSGKRLKGLCPFHSEKTPSFTVSPDTGLFYCYGCQRGGNVFNFLMDVEGLSFPEAVKVLAERAGISLPRSSDEQGTDDILTVNRWASDVFHRALMRSGSSNPALRYLKERDISSESLKHFVLGFAPDRWDFLVNQAEHDGIDAKLLFEAGMIVRRRDGSGYVDRYRNRLMFPLLSPSGEVLGVAGRVMPGNQDSAKYINSPETRVYRKASYVYGLHTARSALKDRRRALLMEGYLDVIQAHQHGLTESLCVSGTALTSEQVFLLRRRVDEVVIIFDGDRAGQAAAERAVGLCLQGGIQPHVVHLPDEEDPDSYLRRYGTERFETAVKQAERGTEYLLRRLRGEFPTQPRTAIRKLVPILAGIPDPLLLEDVSSEIARSLGYSTHAVLGLVKKDSAKKTDSSAAAQFRGAERPALAWEEQLCRYLLIHPARREDVFEDISDTDFNDQSLAGLFEWMKTNAKKKPGSHLVSEIMDDAMRRLVSALLVSETPLAPLEHLLARSRLDRLEKKIRTLKDNMREAERIGDSVRIRGLSEQIQEISAQAEGLKPAGRYGSGKKRSE